MNIKELIKFQEVKIGRAYDYLFSLGYGTWEKLAIENKDEIQLLIVELEHEKTILKVLKEYETTLSEKL